MGHANSTDPVQLQQNVLSDQSPHCLFTGISKQNTVKVEILIWNP